MQTSTIHERLNELDITIDSEFIPFSQSRNAVGNPTLNDLSFNYKVKVKKNGREILTTDYSMGIGFSPDYKQGDRSFRHGDTIRGQVEQGRSSKGVIRPDIADVLHSLIMESDVLNHTSFEDWAESLGYDTDSRSAEKIYQDCLKNALALQNGLGYNTLEELRELFADY